MTRKRFIKLLMAQGRSRNDAVKIAEVVPKFGWSYAQVHRAVLGPIAQCAALAVELVAGMAGLIAQSAALAVELVAGMAGLIAQCAPEGGDG